MKLINQHRLLKVLSDGTYRVDTERGLVYTYNKGTDSWDIMKFGLHDKKYLQAVFFIGKKNSPNRFTAYMHNVVFVSKFGTYDDTMWQVYWKDGDRTNNRSWNLDLKRVPPKREKKKGFGHKLPMIRDKQIRKIKHYLKVVKEENCVRIAEALQLNPRAVQRTVKLLKEGTELRYEYSKGQKNARNGKKWLRADSEEMRRERFVRMNGFDPWLPANKQKESPYAHLFPQFNTGT